MSRGVVWLVSPSWHIAGFLGAMPLQTVLQVAVWLVIAAVVLRCCGGTTVPGVTAFSDGLLSIAFTLGCIIVVCTVAVPVANFLDVPLADGVLWLGDQQNARPVTAVAIVLAAIGIGFAIHARRASRGKASCMPPHQPAARPSTAGAGDPPIGTQERAAPWDD